MCCHLLAPDRASSLLIFSGMESNGFNAPQCCCRGGVAAFHHGSAFVCGTNESSRAQIRDRWRFAPTVPMQWPSRTNKEQAAALLNYQAEYLEVLNTVLVIRRSPLSTRSGLGTPRWSWLTEWLPLRIHSQSIEAVAGVAALHHCGGLFISEQSTR
jgi:hypothetical protein